MGSSPRKELSWWGVVPVGVVLERSCPGGELSQWGVVLERSCPGGELSQWKS